MVFAPGSPAAPLLDRVAALAALALGFGTGRLTLCASGPDPVQVSAADHLRPDVAALLDRQVAGQKVPVVVEDLSRPSAMAGSTHRHGSGSYLGVPVQLFGRVVAVLSVSDAAPRAITARQIRLLVEFGALIAAQLDLIDGVEPNGGGPEEAAEEISRAVAAGEIVPWYQPIVDLATGTVVGVEALARWQRPDGSLDQPAAFVPIAERSDLIIELDFAVLHRALSDLAGWLRVRPDFRVSVNLSGRHLDRADAADALLAAARTAGVAPSSVDLELTETARPSGSQHGRLLLERIRALGFTVWFDDFGSGWSALQDLIQLPVDGIKIDRSFADHLGTPVNHAVIRALTAAATQIGLKVTIEGIETAHQAELARTLGCHLAQGYLWSKPVAGAEVTRWLTEPSAAPTSPAH